MVEQIIFSVIAFVLFTYIFLFEMIRKNDTSYLSIVIIQAVGILIDFIQISSKKFDLIIINIIMYLFCIVIPLLVIILEFCGLNFTELTSSIIARWFITGKDYKKAKKVLIKLVSKNNDSYIGHKLLAEIYEKEGGMRKAIDEYVKVLDIKKNDYKSYYRISILLKNLNKIEESEEMLKILVKQRPDFENASQILGEILYNKEQYKEAINVYVNALHINNNDIDLLYNLGICYCKMNNFSLATKTFKRIVEIDNNNYYAYYRLGQISLLYRDFDSAEQYFIQGATNEYEAKAYYELSKIFIMKNKKEKAIIYLNKAIELDAKYTDKAKTEPILFCLKNDIIKKGKNDNQKLIELSDKEKEIEEYLNNTYNITKALKPEESIKLKNKIKKLKWEN